MASIDDCQAIKRIRDFLVAQIKALRSPNINAQILQQRNFVRYRDLHTFLYKHHATLAEEIGQAYMNTMRWYYLHHFTRYERALSKTKLHIVDKNDVLGNDGSARKPTLLTNTKMPGPPHDAFNLGRRSDTLTSTQPALPSHLAEEAPTTHLEFPFRNFNLALIDNVAAEYTFLTTFFSSLSAHAINRYSAYIFAPVFAIGQSLTRALTVDTHDCLGLLLCIRLAQRWSFHLQRLKIPAADTYLNGISMQLWPRFQLVMDMHCESMARATAALPSGPPSSAAERTRQSAAPHVLTQRFAVFVRGIVELCREAGDDEPVGASLARLRAEMENFLSKAAGVVGEDRKRVRFLENNYALILTIVGEVEGKLAAEQKRAFEVLRDGVGE